MEAKVASYVRPEFQWRPEARAAILAVALIFSTYSQPIEASDPDDEGLVIINPGPTMRLPRGFGGWITVKSLTFSTNECGFLESVKSNRPNLNRTAVVAHKRGQFGAGEDPGGDPEEVTDRGWQGAQDLLSDHPEIAVVTEGVDRWCSEPGFSGDNVDASYASRAPVRSSQSTAHWGNLRNVYFA